MATIRSFEDIIAWQHARKLTQSIYERARTGPLRSDRGLRDQMQRSAVSIMANIAEGFERDGNKEFVNFLYIAKASAGELRSHLYVALDQGYLSTDDFEVLYRQTTSVSRLIYGLIRSITRSDLNGLKHK